MHVLTEFEWYITGEKRLAKNTLDSYLGDLKYWLEAGVAIDLSLIHI